MFLSKGKAKLLVLVATVAIMMLILAKGLWLPWTSPNLAAKYLLLDDGKNPLNDSRNAALMWGEKMFLPLSEKTNQYENIGWLASSTLLDILSTKTKYPDWLLKQFGSSGSTNVKILHCYIEQRGRAVGTESLCGKLLSDKAGRLSEGEAYLVNKANRLLQSE